MDRLDHFPITDAFRRKTCGRPRCGEPWPCNATLMLAFPDDPDRQERFRRAQQGFLDRRAVGSTATSNVLVTYPDGTTVMIASRSEQQANRAVGMAKVIPLPRRPVD